VGRYLSFPATRSPGSLPYLVVIEMCSSHLWPIYGSYKT